MQTNFFTKLTSYGVLQISGANATKFLQGAFTCNLDYLADKCGIGARCNIKGRVSAIFYLFFADACWFLIAPKSLLNDLQQDLTKYAQFARVKVTIAPDLVIFGANSSSLFNKNDIKQLDNAYFWRLFDEHFLLICTQDKAAKLVDLLSRSHQKQDVNAWHLSQIRAGIAQIESVHSGKFVPQMLNLPAIDAVSFKKGCYMGQEVVARMQFLGAAKRQMQRFSANCLPPIIGTNLTNASDKTIGEVILSASTINGCEFLAVIEQKAINEDIFLNNQKVILLDLPYKIDKEAEILR